MQAVQVVRNGLLSYLMAPNYIGAYHHQQAYTYQAYAAPAFVGAAQPPKPVQARGVGAQMKIQTRAPPAPNVTQGAQKKVQTRTSTVQGTGAQKRRVAAMAGAAPGAQMKIQTRAGAAVAHAGAQTKTIAATPIATPPGAQMKIQTRAGAAVAHAGAQTKTTAGVAAPIATPQETKEEVEVGCVGSLCRYKTERKLSNADTVPEEAVIAAAAASGAGGTIPSDMKEEIVMMVKLNENALAAAAGVLEQEPNNGLNAHNEEEDEVEAEINKILAGDELAMNGEILDLQLKEQVGLAKLAMEDRKRFFETKTRQVDFESLKNVGQYEDAMLHDAEGKTAKRVRVCIAKAPFATGGMRTAYCMIVEMDGQEHKFAGKVFMHPAGVETYEREVLNQKSCQDDATRFRGACARKGVFLKVGFAEPFTLEMIERDGNPVLGCEPFLTGSYQKYNNNCGWVSRDESGDVAQAFSHYTYECSGGNRLVCDIQGERTLWTDPLVHTCYGHSGVGDFGGEGMRNFFATHQCNELCERLGLVLPYFGIIQMRYILRDDQVVSEYMM